MKTKKQFFFMRAAMSLLVMLCSLGAWADDSGSCGTNVTYSYVESTHTLTISGTGDMEDYDSSDIPWKYYKSSITSVMIGEGVTSIGNNAFQNCTNLSSVTIPASVTSIGGAAFSGCTSLSSVTIPTSVTSIGNNAFQNCTSLSSVTIPASVTSIENYAFAGCTSLSSITIPASVTSIGNNAFQNCI